MALRNPPNWLQNASHSAENDRLIQQAIWPTTGILGSTSLAITASSPAAMTVKVATGWAAVVGTTQANMGVYTIYNDAQETLNISAADSLLPRVDRIVATVRDSYYSGTSNDVIFQVLAGTPAVSPSAPATPANSISLATIAVGAGVTSITNANITDTRVFVTNNNITTPTTFSGCYIYNNLNTALTNAAFTVIPFDQEVFDTDSYHSTVSNTSRITIPAGKAGKFQVISQINPTNPVGGGIREIRLYKNGVSWMSSFMNPQSAQTTYLFINTIMNLAVGDYIEMYAYQNQGANYTLGSGLGCFFSVKYLGA